MSERRRCMTIALTILTGVVAGPMVSASASTAQTAPADQLLAIVSPIAAPVCSALGSTTFLVPVLGGLATDQLAIQGLNVGDTLLDVLGPLFVVCGNLPGAKGTRCELDTQIAGLYPAQLKSLLPPPTILGGVLEGLDKLIQTLGLPPDALGLGTALMCDVPNGAQAPTAPAAPPAPPGPIATPATSAVFPAPLPPGSSVTLPGLSSAVRPPVAGTPGRTTLIGRVVRDIPGYLTTLQLALAAIVGLYLAASWWTSVRIARRRPKG